MTWRWLTAQALSLALIATGCIAPLPPTAVLDDRGGLVEAPSFSDESNRDLIKQTREQLVLKDRDYLVGPDDVLEISVFEWEFSEQTRTLEFRVSESGTVSLPALGAVTVAGKTVQEIQTAIVEQLSSGNLLQNPRVAITVKEYRSRRIGVVGAVNAPGVYALHQNVSTLVDVLTLAGGPSDTAGEVVYVLRQATANAEPLRIAVDLTGIFVSGNLNQNPVLQGGDVLYVPKAPLIFVYGNVRQPGGFALQRPTQVLDAVALAGGVDGRAAKSECRLMRRRSDGTPATYRINLAEIEAGTAPNPFLRGGDVLNIPQSSGRVAFSELWNLVRGIFTFTYSLDSNK